MSPQEQIESLRKSVGFIDAYNLKNYFYIFLILLVLIALYTQHPVSIMFTLFFLVVFFGSGGRMQGLRDYLKAYDTITPMKTKATIIVEDRLEDDYYAEVRDGTGQIWRIKFNSHEWEPHDGEVDVKVYYQPGKAYPVLLISDDGVIIPMFKPEIVKL